ncbi:hypothetical protein [Streptomyces sp. NPDC058964]|uniref:VMAP-C domain-containing protein n=1 Tax=Streptomyces sp. NPDC058964 TaxID=3346681 RepID=UPI00368FBEA4
MSQSPWARPSAAATNPGGPSRCTRRCRTCCSGWPSTTGGRGPARTGWAPSGRSWCAAPTATSCRTKRRTGRRGPCRIRCRTRPPDTAAGAARGGPPPRAPRPPAPGGRAAGRAPTAEDEDFDRRDRWHRLHAQHAHAQAEILDCDDGVRRPVPGVAALRGLAPRTVPVLCRQGDQRYEDDATALGRIARAGYGVVLWRRWRRQPDSVCGEFHRGVKMSIDDGDGAESLPDLVHGLRRMVGEGRTEAFWADGIALMYDDPYRPLPGTGDLLEAP